MARVAYYRETQLSHEHSVVHLNTMIEGAVKALGADHSSVLSLRDWLSDIKHSETGILVYDRVKVEVNTLSDIEAIETRPGFVRFAIGGYDNIYDLVADRKREGKNDWYV